MYNSYFDLNFKKMFNKIYIILCRYCIKVYTTHGNIVKRFPANIVVEEFAKSFDNMNNCIEQQCVFTLYCILSNEKKNVTCNFHSYIRMSKNIINAPEYTCRYTQETNCVYRVSLVRTPSYPKNLISLPLRFYVTSFTRGNSSTLFVALYTAKQ